MEIKQVEGLLAQEVLYVVSESGIFLLLVSLFHRLDTTGLELNKGRGVASHLHCCHLASHEDWQTSRWLCQVFEYKDEKPLV